MPDIHLLANRASLLRVRIAENRVVTAADGADVVADTKAQVDRQHRVLDVELQVIEALDLRIKTRPPLPPPQALQDLVRAGRRRLERERQGGARDWHGRRLALADTLRRGLER